MEKIKLSFIVANYNTSDLTIRCVKSILDNCNMTNKQIIMVDDFSRKEESDKLISFWKNTDYKYVIELIILKENKGIGNAMNEGIKHSSGNCIIRLDNDTEIIEKDFDETLVKFLMWDEKLGLVSCLTDNISSPAQKIIIPETFKGNNEQTLNYIKNRDIEELKYYSEPKHCFAGFCMCFRKEDYDKIGGFSVKTKILLEDNLFYLDMIDLKMKCAVAQKLFINHLYHGTIGNFTKEELEQNSIKARELFLERVNKK